MNRRAYLKASIVGILGLLTGKVMGRERKEFEDDELWLRYELPKCIGNYSRHRLLGYRLCLCRDNVLVPLRGMPAYTSSAIVMQILVADVSNKDRLPKLLLHFDRLRDKVVFQRIIQSHTLKFREVYA